MPLQTELCIRPFQPGDQEAARALILAGMREHWGRAFDPDRFPDLIDIQRSYARGTFLVAYGGENLVGTGALLPERRGEARISRVSVAKEVRRQGIGTALIARLCEAARKQEYRKIHLETTSTWKGVIAFYSDCGFDLLGTWNGDTHFVLQIDKLDQSA